VLDFLLIGCTFKIDAVKTRPTDAMPSSFLIKYMVLVCSALSIAIMFLFSLF
jgi:hypothetical protein